MCSLAAQVKVCVYAFAFNASEEVQKMGVGCQERTELKVSKGETRLLLYLVQLPWRPRATSPRFRKAATRNTTVSIRLVNTRVVKRKKRV